MNVLKRMVSVVMLLLFSLLIVACEDNENKLQIITNPDRISLPQGENIAEPRERYENKFGEDKIPGQWEGYGIGDPFVLRYNGTYYLYASTKDSEVGIRAWKSKDLIHWEKVTGEGLQEGYVSEDPITRGAYAPEVIYWNGIFYMYTSPRGEGHYVLTADSPEGPFVAVTDNLGNGIDGSVFIDDDEKMYFLRSHNQGIQIHEMSDPLSIGKGTTLDNTAIGNWTEGPTLFKREGIYYLTYTGTHVTSPGYRVNYAYSYENPSNRTSFRPGANNHLLLNTDEQFNGLGHNSIVLGPDMDSYYIVYHNLNSAAGPNRSFNIDRIVFNGSRMVVLGPTLSGAQVPPLPEFSAPNTAGSQFTNEGGFVLSTASSEENYTAEFNFSGTDDIKFVSSYKDSKNYLYVRVSFTDKTIELVQVKDGKELVKGEGTLVNTFMKDKLHTIRISVRDRKADVYFDNLRKIIEAPIEFSGGKIGYYSTDKDASYYYTAFSNVAKGLSDQKEAKRVSGTVEANLYLEDDYRLRDGSGLKQLTVNENDPFALYYQGAQSLTLANQLDYATYLLDIQEEGFYGFAMLYNKENAGKKIGIQIDDASVMVVTLPEVNSTADYVKALVTEFDLPAGLHTIRLIHVGDNVEFVSFDLFLSSKVTPQFEHSLSDYVDRGVEYKTIWKLKDGGHYALAGNQQVLFFGDNRLTDFTLEVSFKFIGETLTSSAGILFRADNLAISNHEGYDSVQGYYLSMNNHRIVLNKYDYNLSQYNLQLNTQMLSSEQIYKLKLEVYGNTFTATINGTEIFSYTDPYPFTHGRIALYTEGAEVIFKDIKIYVK